MQYINFYSMCLLENESEMLDICMLKECDVFISATVCQCVYVIRKVICRKQLELSEQDGALSSNGINVLMLSVCVSYDVANVLNMLCRCSVTLLNK